MLKYSHSRGSAHDMGFSAEYVLMNNHLFLIFMQQLLDKLDVLECFEDEHHALRIGELLSKQAEIYDALGVTSPTSSC